ncbi:MAG: hypothetical protein Fur002_03370 [Anaerolineales bacterium]
MLSVADFIRLPCAPSLTEGGIAYALRQVPRRAAGGAPFRRLVSHAAVEIALRRYLTEQAIPFEVANSPSLDEYERQDALLAGQRCDLKSFFISHPADSAAMQDNPQILLRAPALIPSDINAREGLTDGDLYIFAFAAAGSASARPYWIHFTPKEWSAPLHWNPLGKLILKSDAEENVQVEIHGRDAAGGFLSRVENLLPQKRAVLADDFYAVTSLHVRGAPAARLGIHAEYARMTRVIAPAEWENVWTPLAEIVLAGYLPRGEFRRRARHLPPNSNVFQFSHTRVKNLFVPVQDLKPFKMLLDKMR